MEIKHKAFDTGKIVLGRNSVRNRCICLAVLFFFVLNTFLPPVYAFELPSLFDSLQTPFEPILLKGVSFDYNDPFHFEFIVDQGREKSKNEQVLKNEIRPLIEYFLLGLTVPEEDLWVNLSYYEQDRILPDQLNGTAIGKTFVTQDLLLKKIASSLTFPEGKEGKVFWEELYSRMRAIYKTTNIPVDILNKVWIVPDQAVVVTYKNKAFVAKASLKVMLDEDFEAVNRHVAATADNKVPGETKRDVNKISTDLMREKILPLIEKKINTSKEFAALRQVYYSLILATYYKNLLKDSIFYLYVNKNKTKTLQLSDPKLKDKIYEEYLQQYKDGIYQHVRKEYDEQRHAMVSKRYVSGGVQMSVSSAIVTVPSSSAVLSAVRESFDAPVEAKVDIQQRVGEGDLNRQTTSGVAAAASSGVEAGVKEAIKSSMLDNIKEAVNKAWPVILLGVMVSIPPTIFSISTSDVFVNRSAAELNRNTDDPRFIDFKKHFIVKGFDSRQAREVERGIENMWFGEYPLKQFILSGIDPNEKIAILPHDFIRKGAAGQYSVRMTTIDLPFIPRIRDIPGTVIHEVNHRVFYKKLHDGIMGRLIKTMKNNGFQREEARNLFPTVMSLITEELAFSTSASHLALYKKSATNKYPHVNALELYLMNQNLYKERLKALQELLDKEPAKAEVIFSFIRQTISDLVKDDPFFAEHEKKKEEETHILDALKKNVGVEYVGKISPERIQESLKLTNSKKKQRLLNEALAFIEKNGLLEKGTPYNVLFLKDLANDQFALALKELNRIVVGETADTLASLVLKIVHEGTHLANASIHGMSPLLDEFLAYKATYDAAKALQNVGISGKYDVRIQKLVSDAFGVLVDDAEKNEASRFAGVLETELGIKPDTFAETFKTMYYDKITVRDSSVWIGLTIRDSMGNVVGNVPIRLDMNNDDPVSTLTIQQFPKESRIGMTNAVSMIASILPVTQSMMTMMARNGQTGIQQASSAIVSEESSMSSVRTLQDMVEYVKKQGDVWIGFADMMKLGLRDQYYGSRAADFFIEDALKIANQVLSQHGGAAVRKGDRSDEIAIVLPQVSDRNGLAEKTTSQKAESIFFDIQRSIYNAYQQYVFAFLPYSPGLENALAHRTVTAEKVKTLESIQGKSAAVDSLAVLFKKMGNAVKTPLEHVKSLLEDSVPDISSVDVSRIEAHRVHPPYLPAGFIGITAGNDFTLDALNERVQQADVAQGVAKERKDFVGTERDAQQEEQDKKSHATLYDGSQKEVYEAEIKRIQPEIVRDLEGVVKLDDGYPALKRTSLGATLDFVMNLPSTEHRTYLVRGPPDSFYIVQRLGDLWQVSLVKHVYVPRTTGLRGLFEKIQALSGRSIREWGKFGFKVINDISDFGHLFGNQLIALEGISLFHAHEQEGIAGSLSSLSDTRKELMGELSHLLSSERLFDVEIDATIVKSTDFESSVTVDETETVLRKLSNARNREINLETSNDGRVRVREYSANKNVWDAIEQESDVTEAYNRQRAGEQLDETHQLFDVYFDRQASSSIASISQAAKRAFAIAGITMALSGVFGPMVSSVAAQGIVSQAELSEVQKRRIETEIRQISGKHEDLLEGLPHDLESKEQKKDAGATKVQGEGAGKEIQIDDLIQGIRNPKTEKGGSKNFQRFVLDSYLGELAQKAQKLKTEQRNAFLSMLKSLIVIDPASRGRAEDPVRERAMGVLKKLSSGKNFTEEIWSSGILQSAIYDPSRTIRDDAWEILNMAVIHTPRMRDTFFVLIKDMMSDEKSVSALRNGRAMEVLAQIASRGQEDREIKEQDVLDIFNAFLSGKHGPVDESIYTDILRGVVMIADRQSDQDAVKKTYKAIDFKPLLEHDSLLVRAAAMDALKAYVTKQADSASEAYKLLATSAKTTLDEMVGMNTQKIGGKDDAKAKFQSAAMGLVSVIVKAQPTAKESEELFSRIVDRKVFLNQTPAFQQAAMSLFASIVQGHSQAILDVVTDNKVLFQSSEQTRNVVFSLLELVQIVDPAVSVEIFTRIMQKGVPQRFDPKSWNIELKQLDVLHMSFLEAIKDNGFVHKNQTQLKNLAKHLRKIVEDRKNYMLHTRAVVALGDTASVVQDVQFRQETYRFLEKMMMAQNFDSKPLLYAMASLSKSLQGWEKIAAREKESDIYERNWNAVFYEDMRRKMGDILAGNISLPEMRVVAEWFFSRESIKNKVEELVRQGPEGAKAASLLLHTYTLVNISSIEAQLYRQGFHPTRQNLKQIDLEAVDDALNRERQSWSHRQIIEKGKTRAIVAINTEFVDDSSRFESLLVGKMGLSPTDVTIFKYQQSKDEYEQARKSEELDPKIKESLSKLKEEFLTFLENNIRGTPPGSNVYLHFYMHGKDAKLYWYGGELTEKEIKEGTGTSFRVIDVRKDLVPLLAALDKDGVNLKDTLTIVIESCMGDAAGTAAANELAKIMRESSGEGLIDPNNFPVIITPDKGTSIATKGFVELFSRILENKEETTLTLGDLLSVSNWLPVLEQREIRLNRAYAKDLPTGSFVVLPGIFDRDKNQGFGLTIPTIYISPESGVNEFIRKTIKGVEEKPSEVQDEQGFDATKPMGHRQGVMEKKPERKPLLEGKEYLQISLLEGSRTFSSSSLGKEAAPARASSGIEDDKIKVGNKELPVSPEFMRGGLHNAKGAAVGFGFINPDGGLLRKLALSESDQNIVESVMKPLFEVSTKLVAAIDEFHTWVRSMEGGETPGTAKKSPEALLVDVENEFQGFQAAMHGLQGIQDKGAIQNDNLRRYANLALEQGGRVEGWIRQLFGLSVEMTEETKNLEWFMNSIKERFEFSVKAGNQDIGLEIQIDKSLHELTTYFDVVDIAIWETLVNASKYSGASKIILRVSPEDNSVKFEIEDNGQGIPEDKLHRVFIPGDRLGRTEEDGTGYGLSGAKDAVERIANGSMDVRSATGKGTIFMVIVPLRSASSGMTDRQSQATSPDRTTQDAKSGAEQGGIHFGGINVETVNQAELQQLPFYKSRIEPYLGQIDLQNFNGFSFEIISIQKVSKRDLLS